MTNFTYDELEVGRIAYRQGLKWGKILKSQIEDGTIDPTKPIRLKLTLGEINIENFSAKTRFLMALGSTRAGVTGNSIITGAGLFTGGSSIIGYKATTDPTAKICYALSVVFSGSAVTSGGMAVIARSCQISETAALSEACATAFMFLGKQAHVTALHLEGKPIPPHLKSYVRKSLRQSVYNNNGLSFVMPSGTNCIIWSEVIERVPFETIGKFVGIGLSVYGYSKLIIVSYRYSQQLFNKFQTRRKSAVLRKQASLALRTDLTTRIYRVYLIKLSNDRFFSIYYYIYLREKIDV